MLILFRLDCRTVNACASRAGGLEFKFRSSQSFSVANGSSPLQQ